MKRLLSLVAAFSTVLAVLLPSVAFADDSFLVGDWSTSSGDASFAFHADGTCVSDFGFWPEQGTWKTQDTGSAAFPIEIDGSSVLWLMQLAYGGVDESYHFEVLKCNDDNFFLVQVYGEYNAWTSKCKLPLTRAGAKADFTLPPEEGQSEAAEASVSEEDRENAIVQKPIKFDDNNTLNLNWGWNLFSKDASEYDHDIAMAAIALSQAAEMSQSEAESRLSDLGFENAKSTFYDNWYEAFTPGVSFASKVVKMNGEDKMVFAIVVRGTDPHEIIGDVAADIGSIFDGFYQSSQKVRAEFLEYYEEVGKGCGFSLSSDNCITFITGHSLGGATANLLGQSLMGVSGRKSTIFDYTFASPNVETFKYDVDSYTNIHNIVNDRDDVPGLPWGYKKYGHIWHYDSLDLIKFSSAYSKVYDSFGWAPLTVIQRHDLRTYLSMMLCDLPNNMGSGAINPYSLTSVHCPVDIAVYSPDGVLMGATKGEDVTIEETSTVLVMVDGDEKYVFAPPGEPYTVKITGTGSGEMTVAQQSIDPDTGEVVSEKSFENVAVEEGRQFTLAVSGEAQVDDVSLEIAESGDRQGSAEVGQSDTEQGDSGIQWWQILLIGVGVVALVFVILLVIGTVKNTRKQNKRKKKASKKRKRK